MRKPHHPALLLHLKGKGGFSTSGNSAEQVRDRADTHIHQAGVRAGWRRKRCPASEETACGTPPRPEAPASPKSQRTRRGSASRCSRAPARNAPARNRPDYAGKQEEKIEDERMRARRKNGMDLKHVVVNRALHQIEDTPSRQEGAHDLSARRPARRTCEHPYPCDRAYPHGQVKPAVLTRLPLEHLNGVGPTGLCTTDQMMPAKNLMQHDPVKETSEGNAQDHQRTV